MKAFGIAPSSIKKVFANPKDLIRDEFKSKALLISKNPYNKCYMNLERDWFKTQLLEPELLQELQDRYTQFLGQSLAWKDLSTLYIVSSNSAMNFKTVSLKGFARHTVSYCSTSTFFGRALLRVASSFGQDYQDFEEESWKIFYRLPWFLARSSHAAKAKALDGLERYLLLPEEERSELAWLFQTMNTELRYLSVPPRDVAGITMIIIWASVFLLPSPPGHSHTHLHKGLFNDRPLTAPAASTTMLTRSPSGSLRTSYTIRLCSRLFVPRLTPRACHPALST